MSRRRLFCLLFALTAGCAVPCNSQVLYGSMVGSVVDATAAGVPAARIKIINQATNETREVQANELGTYTLSTIPAGTYAVEISKEGFRMFAAQNVVVRLNSAVRVDATLDVGQVSEKIEVSAPAAALQTERADVRADMTTRAMVELPQPTRTYQGLIALMPGVAPPSASGGGTNNPGKSMQITANGTSRSATAVRIDGVTATNPWVQFFSSYVPSIESIETVNVVTATPDAEQGLTNGAAISVQTKSGTNTLHGSAFGYHVNGTSSLRARNFFLPANQSTPKLLQHDVGGSLGGPMKRERLFYFVSYEANLTRQAGANRVSVPTAAMRAGEMSASVNPIYDPNTGTSDGRGRTPFPDNRIPANRISPIAQKLVALLPDANVAGAGLVNNYYVSTPIANDLHHLDTKLDWNATSKLRVTGRFGLQPYSIDQKTAFGETLAGPNARYAHGNVIATAVSVTYTLSPNLVLDGTWGLTRANQILQPPSVDKKLGADFLGIPGTNVGELPLAGGMPQFIISGFTNIGYDYPYLQYVQPIYQYTANASWIKRSHNLRFGLDINRQHMNHKEVQPTQFNFTGGVTGLNGGPAPNQYNAYADFLLGLPNRHQNSWLTSDWVTLRTWQHSLYIRDQWQVNRKLTLTYGSRWEYFPVPMRDGRGIELLDFDTLRIQICGVAGNADDCGIKVSKRLFSPRVGFAYRVLDTFVIRAGYSLNPEQINMARDGLYSYPNRFDYVANGSNSFVAVAPLSSGIPVQPRVDFSSGFVTLPQGASYEAQAAVLPKKFVRGYTESWNFMLQRDFGHGWIGQAGYVGTFTLKQHTRYNLNYGQVGGGAPSQPFFSRGITGKLTYIQPLEQMKYHSMQTSMTRRFSGGLELLASYTWSKWTGLCCDDSGDGEPAIPIPEYRNLTRALMNGDRPHNLRISWLYELPFGKGRVRLTSGMAGTIAGGWQINGILSAYSGAPFTPSASAASLNAPGSSQRADQVKPEVQMTRTVDSWFDPLAYAPLTTARFGTAGFNSLRGPGVVNLDVSIFRAFRLSERIGMQFRAEALNVSNTPHFSNPGANVSNMSLNSDGSIRALNGFTQITSTNAPSRLIDERYMRFGLRFSF